MSSRERILQKIREAGEKVNDLPVPNWEEADLILPDGNLTLYFKEELEKAGGVCYVCNDYSDVQNNLDVECSRLSGQNIDALFAGDDQLLKLAPELLKPLKHDDYRKADLILTDCACLIAQTGTVVASNLNAGGNKAFSSAPIHIVFAKEDQIMPTLREGFIFLQNYFQENWPEHLSFITGSSRTADIEKTLVMGAHGPSRLVVMILKK